MSTVYELINDAVLVEKGKDIVSNTTNNFFANLRSTVTQNNYTEREYWEAYLKIDEDKWMEDYHGSDPDAKHPGGKIRAGTWKYRTYLPNPYTSAKSIIGTCLDKGISVEGKTKKELQDAINGKVPGSTELAPDSNVNKFERSWRKCKRYFDSATLEEQKRIHTFMFDNEIGG